MPYSNRQKAKHELHFSQMNKQMSWFCARAKKKPLDTIHFKWKKSKFFRLLEKKIHNNFIGMDGHNGKTDWNSQCALHLAALVFDIEKFCHRQSQRERETLTSTVDIISHQSSPLFCRSPIEWVSHVWQRKLKRIGQTAFCCWWFLLYFYGSCNRFRKQLWDDSSIGRIESIRRY